MLTEKISGFREFDPTDRVVESYLENLFRFVFELYGFGEIKTRSVELLSTLESKGETSKQIYLLERLQDFRLRISKNEEERQLRDCEDNHELSKGKRKDQEKNPLGLHFDLTVPFSRYVLENLQGIVFPFRRYQIQTVWRGERAQAGRFREFTQADIDLVSNGNLDDLASLQVAETMLFALGLLPLGKVHFQVNSRLLMEEIFRLLNLTDANAIFGIIDKYDKIGEQGVERLLLDEGIAQEKVAILLEVAKITTAKVEDISNIFTSLGLASEQLDRCLVELGAFLDKLRQQLGLLDLIYGKNHYQSIKEMIGRFDLISTYQTEYDLDFFSKKINVEACLRISRGLDYYTGLVFETTIDANTSLGSICSGGVYGHLLSTSKSTYPGVGLSIGLTRLADYLCKERLIEAKRYNPSAALIIHQGDLVKSCLVANLLRLRGIKTEVYPKGDAIGKQLRYADRSKIPFVWFPDFEEVKEISTGIQVKADPSNWNPNE